MDTQVTIKKYLLTFFNSICCISIWTFWYLWPYAWTNQTRPYVCLNIPSETICDEEKSFFLLNKRINNWGMNCISQRIFNKRWKDERGKKLSSLLHGLKFISWADTYVFVWVGAIFFLFKIQKNQLNDYLWFYQVFPLFFFFLLFRSL